MHQHFSSFLYTDQTWSPRIKYDAGDSSFFVSDAFSSFPHMVLQPRGEVWRFVVFVLFSPGHASPYAKTVFPSRFGRPLFPSSMVLLAALQITFGAARPLFSPFFLSVGMFSFFLRARRQGPILFLSAASLFPC